MSRDIQEDIIGMIATLYLSIIILMAIYTITFIIATLFTFMDLNWNKYEETVCPIKRNVDYVFPVRPVACWLYEERE